MTAKRKVLRVNVDGSDADLIVESTTHGLKTALDSVFDEFSSVWSNGDGSLTAEEEGLALYITPAEISEEEWEQAGEHEWEGFGS